MQARKSRSIGKKLCLASFVALGWMNPASALQAFPGAEGFGGQFTGAAPAGGWFSNATIYHVTTTQDLLDGTGKPATGTLRAAFLDAQKKELARNVIVVFDVGGTFTLTQGSLDIKTVNNFYVAGQTAPSPVTVYGNTTQITHSNNTANSNVILRYMTFRKGTGDGADAITFAGGSGDGTGSIATNMILDHVSASWSEDENLSVANNNTNVTVQYSIISDSLVNGHAYGSLVRPRSNSSVTYHHNLYANNASRNARPGSYNGNTLDFDFRNNVVYNWRDRASYTGGSSEADQEHVNVNYVGNYLIAGPSTIANADGAFIVDKNVDAVAYETGNLVDGDKAVNPGGQPTPTTPFQFKFSTPVTDQTLTMVGAPFNYAPVTTQSANDAYWQVVNYAGNYWWAREAIDARIIGNVLNNTNPPDGVAAAAPNAAELAGVTGAATTTRPAGWDTDNDGMPDAWELAHGLNPNLASDFALDFDTDGYINVVEYLNEAGAFPAPAPIVWNGAVNNRYAVSGNYDLQWEPSRFDTVKINTGMAVVDAIGQKAGKILVGTDAGSNGKLLVNSGWLAIADRLEAGSASGSAGTIELAGGTVRVARMTRIRDTGNLQFTGGSLDMMGGAAVFDYSVNSPISAVKDMISAGYNNGAWNGNGINSSVANAFNANPANAGKLAIGYAEASSINVPGNVFFEENIDGTTVVAAVTLVGDTNLDLVVDSADFTALAANWGQSGQVWSDGDVNYDGSVNTLDFNLLAGNFGQSLASPTLGSVVPEPLSLSPMVLFWTLLTRRRSLTP